MMRGKEVPFGFGVGVWVCLVALAVGGPAAAARLELRGRQAGPGGEVRIPLGEQGTVDVWMDAQGERIRTLSLFIHYDPAVLEPVDADLGKEGVNPFAPGSYMPQPSESLNGVLAGEGELILGVTNQGDVTASGQGVVASFRMKAVGPGPATDLVVDFRYPLNFTAYEVMDAAGNLQPADFQRSQVKDLRVLIGAGLLLDDLPDRALPGGAQDRSLLLDEFVVDAIYPDAQLRWTITGNQRVQVEMDENRRVTFTAPDGWSGQERVLFTVTSPDGLTAADGVTVSVIGPPRWRRDSGRLPEVVLAEDGLDRSRVLDAFLVPDALNPPAQLQWSVVGRGVVRASVDAATASLVLQPPPDWSGQDTLVLTVSNRYGLADTTSMVVTVLAVNDPPVLAGLAPVTLAVGAEFAGPYLAALATDVDDDRDSLLATVAGDSVVDARWAGGRLVLTGLRPGQGTVRVVLRDPHGAVAVGTMAVAVVDPSLLAPVLNPPADWAVTAGSLRQLRLDDLVTDADTPDSLLLWSVVVEPPLTVSVDAARVASIWVPSGFVGSAQLTLAVADPEGHLASAGLRIDVTVAGTAVPEVAAPALLRLPAGQATTWALDDWVADPDTPDSLLTWSVTAAAPLTAAIQADRRLVLWLPAGTVGSLALSGSVRDPEGHAAVWSAWVRADSATVPDSGLQLPGELGLVAGDTLNLDLAAPLGPGAAAALQWEWVLPPGVSVRLDGDWLRLTVAPGSLGLGMVISTATDLGGRRWVDTLRVWSAATAGGLTVQPPPVFDLVPGPGVRLALDPWVYSLGFRRDQLTWRVAHAPAGVAIDLDPGARVAELRWLGPTAGMPLVAFPDTAVLEVSDPAGRRAAVDLRLRLPGTGPPDWALQLPDTAMAEGGHLSLRLDPSVQGIDPSLLTWRLIEAWPGAIDARVDSAGRALDLDAPVGTSGRHQWVLGARDPLGRQQLDTLVVAVQPAGLFLLPLPSLDLVAGQVDTSIVPAAVLSGVPVGAVTWQVTPGEFIGAALEPGSGRLRVWAPLGAAGADSVILTARDAAGQTAAQVLRVRVEEVWELAALDPVTLESGGVAVVALDRVVRRGRPERLMWSVTAGTHLEATYDAARRQVRLQAIHAGPWVEELLLEAVAPTGQRLRTSVWVQVEAVALALHALPDWVLRAGVSDTTWALDGAVAAGDPAAVRWRVDGALSITASIDDRQRQLVLSVPPGFVGEEWLVLSAELGSRSAVAVFHVVVRAPSPGLELRPFPDLELTAGQADSSVVLTDYLAGGDPDSVLWEVTASAGLSVELGPGKRLVVAATDSVRAGQVIVTSRWDGAIACDTLAVRVLPVASQLRLAPVPEQRLAQGAIDSSLVLDPYLSGGDAAQAMWSVRGGRTVLAFVDPATHRVWFDASRAEPGLEVFFVDASLAGRRVSGILRVAVTARYLVILPLPALDLNAAPATMTLALDGYVQGDWPPAAVRWQVATAQGVGAALDTVSHVLAVTALPGVAGPASVQLLAVPPVGQAQAAALVVRVATPPAPLPPQLATLPLVTAVAGSVLTPLDLDSYVRGEDPAGLSWRVVDTGRVLLAIDTHSHLLTLTVPTDLAGDETRQVAAMRMSDGSETVATLLIRAQPRPTQAPVLSLPAALALRVGEWFDLDLGAWVSDADTPAASLRWHTEVSAGVVLQHPDEAAVVHLLAAEVTAEAPRLQVEVRDPEGNRAAGSVLLQLVAVDRTAPELVVSVAPHAALPRVLRLVVRANEPLAAKPVVSAAGEELAVEEAEDHYLALYPAVDDGVVTVTAQGQDAAGNRGSGALTVSLQLQTGRASSLVSADGQVQLNLPAGALAPGHLAFVVVSPPGEGHVRAAQLGFCGVEALTLPAELVFAGLPLATATGHTVQRWDPAQSAWLDLPGSLGTGNLAASVEQSGDYAVGTASAGAALTRRGVGAEPNPFAVAATLRYVVTTPGWVRVVIYDLQGRRLRLLADGFQREGPWSVRWDGTDDSGQRVATGLYLYQVQGGGPGRTGKLTLVR